MIVRAGVLPHPPLLVPQLVVGHDPDVQAVRDACLAVAGALVGAARCWLAVGAADVAQVCRIGPDAAGTFAGYGVDVPVRLGPDADADAAPDRAMPLPALVAGWLREQVDADRVGAVVVPADLPTRLCRELGEQLAAEAGEPLALLVLGDGSHRHGDRAVGAPDERARAFDQRVHQALADADPRALLDLDADLAAELGAVGRAPWQVLAGAIGEARWRSSRAQLIVPFGVAYHVALLDRV